MAAARATALKTRVRVSRAEQQMEELLDMMGVTYERSVPMGRWIVDFVLEPERVVVEVHGSYWHDKPSAAARDQRKRVTLEGQGWTVLFARTDQMHRWFALLESTLGRRFPSTT